MLARLIIVVATTTVLGTCTGSDPFRSGFGRPTAASELEEETGKQTLASKVLGAIAFERVTGRRPDPASLDHAPGVRKCFKTLAQLARFT
jgi:hypothetical protein